MDGPISIPVDKVPGKLELDRACWNCWKNGNGIDPACEFCGGKGFRLTDAGEALMEFLDRWKDIGR